MDMVASTLSDVINAADHSPSPTSSVPCSICLDLVIDDGDRSIAKLYCGHKFHLDCIGSAFNSKGAMQCPNCRKVESGRWLFADGSAHAVTETGGQDWMPHEGPHDLSYSRRPIGLRWHPFGGFMVHSSFDFRETESLTLNTFAHFLGNYAMIAEHTAAPSSARSYVSHFRPNEHVTNSNIQHQLNSHPAPRNNIRSTYIQHPSWGWNCHFLPYNADRDFIDHGNLTPVNPTTLRSTQAVNPTTLRSTQAQPIYYTQRLVSRTRESSGANSQSRERNQIHHAAYHHEQPSEVTNMPSFTYGFRRFGGALALPMILPAVPHQPHNHGVHGSYIGETERDESSYVPILHGSFHHRRS